MSLLVHIANWDTVQDQYQSQKIQPTFYGRRNDNNNVVRVHVNGFRPHFFVSCIEVAYRDKHMNIEHQVAIQTILERLYGKGEQICNETESEAVVEKWNFWGYQEKKQKFFHFRFVSLAAYRFVKNIFENLSVFHHYSISQLQDIVSKMDDFYDRIRKKFHQEDLKNYATKLKLNVSAIQWLWELEQAQLPLAFAYMELFSVIDPLLQVVHERDLQIAGCVELKHVRSMERKEAIQTFYVHFDNMFPVSINQAGIVLPTWTEMAFDLEVYSNDENVFPVHTIEENSIFQISVVLRKGSFQKIFLLHLKALHHQYETMVDQIKLASGDTQTVLEYTSEIDLLHGFRDLINSEDPDYVLGYNDSTFDWKYAMGRAEVLNILSTFATYSRRPKHVCKLQTQSLSSKAYGDNTYHFVEAPGRTTIDVMAWLQKEVKLETYKLADVGDVLLKETKHDVSAKYMFRAFKNGDLQSLKIVGQYCIQDSLLVIKLVLKTNLLPRLLQMANINYTSLSHLLYRGQSVKAFSALFQKAYNFFCIPHIVEKDEETYPGSVVLEPEPGLYKKPVVIDDFGSLYPSIMIQYNLDYTTLVLNPVLIRNIKAVEEKKADFVPAKERITECLVEYNGQEFLIIKWVSNMLCKLADDGETVLQSYISLEAAVEGNATLNKTKLLEEMKKKTFQWKNITYWYAVHQNKIGIIPQLQINLKKSRSSVKKEMAKLENSDLFEDKLKYNSLDGTQLAIKVTMNCMPSHNHEILTEHGFFTLQKILDHFERHTHLQIACYTPESKSLVYAKIDKSKVLQSTGKHEILSFGSIKTKNGVSVDVTGNHRMYVKCMKNKSDCTKTKYDIIDAQKVKEKLQPYKDEAVLQFHAHCESGLSAGEDFPEWISETLGLHNKTETNAFLQLYGYWLGDGYLDGTKRAVSFSPVKCSDTKYLNHLISSLPQRVQENTSITDTPHMKTTNTWDKPHCIHITDSMFWLFFAKNYGHKYEHVNCLSEAVKSGLCYRPKSYKEKEFSEDMVLRSKNTIGTHKGKSLNRNRIINGIHERICYNDNCSKPNVWRSLTEFSSRTRRHLKLIEGRCKQCMSTRVKVNLEKKKALLHKQLTDRYDSSGTNIEDAEDVKAQKWFMQWCFKLSAESTELLLRGLNMADGGSKDKNKGHMCILTSSEKFADQVAQLGFHAGYSSLRRVNTQKGTSHNHNRKGIAIVARATSWSVRLSKFSRECEPKMINMVTNENMQESNYTGTVWCVNVPLAPNLIIVRKFEEIRDENANITKHTSRPIIISNSLYGFTAAPKLCLKHLSRLTTTIGRDLLLKSKYYMENLFKDEAKLLRWQRNDVAAYMTKDGKEINVENGQQPAGSYPVHPAAKEGELMIPNDLKVEVIAGDTDSIFCHYPTLTLAQAISIGPKSAEMITRHLNKKYIVMNYEKTFCPLLIERKKRYMGCKYTVPLDTFKVDMTGLAMKRRNYAPITRNNLWRLYHHIMQVVPNPEKPGKFIKQEKTHSVIEELSNLTKDYLKEASTTTNFDDFAISASLKNEYKNENLTHVALAKRMEIRDPASRPKAGQRYKYIIVRDFSRPDELAQKSETIEYAQAHNLRPDMEFYLVQQITNPILTLMRVIGLREEAENVLQACLNEIHKLYDKERLQESEKKKRSFFIDPPHVPQTGGQKKKTITKRNIQANSSSQSTLTQFFKI